MEKFHRYKIRRSPVLDQYGNIVAIDKAMKTRLIGVGLRFLNPTYITYYL
jgi:hypothetical protein